ncbi:di-trans,poly-cis-decaprenylcistransferase [Candidatus Pacearchaeota archaeon]|nr:di-trans,poly-cis-decaprenylcistransferase [Candidatus Pacearchaeota archaeon]
MAEENNYPKHIAVILDGNRRFAKAKNLQVYKGHEAGADKFEEFLKWANELEINEVTAYVLSNENLKREKAELDFLFSIFKRWFSKFEKEAEKNKIKIHFAGNLDLVPKDVKELAEKIQYKTQDYKEKRINFCFAYGGRQELVNAFNQLAKKGKKSITEQDIQKELWLESEPDLVIRTGNAIRTSNFLPWQTIYSEWFFLKKMWPEFEKKDLIKIIADFKKRKRNFGK